MPGQGEMRQRIWLARIPWLEDKYATVQRMKSNNKLSFKYWAAGNQLSVVNKLRFQSSIPKPKTEN